MSIYLDELFVLNGALNYLLLAASARLGGGVIHRGRLGLAAGLGGVYAAVSLVPALAFLRAGVMQAATAAGMLLLAFGARRRTLRLGVLFFALALALGGTVFLSTQVFGAEVLLLSSGAYYPVSALGLLLLASGGYLLAYTVFSRVCEHGGGEITELTLELRGRSAPLRALRDTGNSLRDPITNERVLIAEARTACALLPEGGWKAAAFARPDVLLPELARAYPELRFRLIPYKTVGTEAGMLLAVRCRVTDKKGRSRAVLTAFSPNGLSDGGNFNALTA